MVGPKLANVSVNWLNMLALGLCSSAIFFSIRLIDFFHVDVLDSIMSRALVLGKVWWGPDQHHVKYIAWPSPHFSKRYRAIVSIAVQY